MDAISIAVYEALRLLILVTVLAGIVEIADAALCPSAPAAVIVTRDGLLRLDGNGFVAW